MVVTTGFYLHTYFCFEKHANLNNIFTFGFDVGPTATVTAVSEVLYQPHVGITQISGFNTNGIKLDEIRSLCQESIDQQKDIQCFQEVCRDTRNSTILQQFLTDIKRSNRASKSVWDASRINIDSEYKPGGTAGVAFRKTARRVIQQGIDNLGRWSWMAF